MRAPRLASYSYRQPGDLVPKNAKGMATAIDKKGRRTWRPGRRGLCRLTDDLSLWKAALEDHRAIWARPV